MHVGSELFFGTSDAWRRVQRQIEWMAPSDLPLVLLGPTGCGKSALASYIHRRSGRRGELVEHALGAVSDNLQADALMGHRRGSFTGAFDDRAGLVERAKDGTFFLDEIGLATKEVQGLLLGLMEGRPFTPIGASRTITVNVRMIFGTNVNPRQQVASGAWQPDFYYRLGGNFLVLPSLAERRDDILPMARIFLARFLQRYGRHCAPVFSSEVERLLLHYPWPGNVRQLQALCHRVAVSMTDGAPVRLADLSEDFLADVQDEGEPRDSDSATRRVCAALQRHGGNRSAAARELGIHRNKLIRFLARHPVATAIDDPVSHLA
jgi:DNA-binding NtrC family response regulator